MNVKGIIFFLGISSLIISFFSFLNILYSIYFNFNLDLNSYIITLTFSLVLGSFFCILGKNNSKNISFNDQIVLIFLCYIFLPLILCFPYFFSSHDISFINSYFESISGFTATGFSIINNVEEINEPLLLWRSTSQWYGGLIFLTIILGALSVKRVKIKPIYLILEGESEGNFFNNFNYNFIKILLIYSLTTIFIIFVYNIVNIRFFDSFNLALTTVSSGGFLSKNALSKITANDFQIFILSLTMLFPIFNFYLLFKLSTKKFNFKDHQEDLHLLIVIAFTILFFYFLIIPEENLSNVFLAVTSSLSTSGIAIYNSNYDISLFAILLTLIGGSIISTSSGLKYIRLYILLKISYQEIYKLVKPKNVFNRNLFSSGSKIFDEDSKICFFIFISFIISMFLLSSILTLDSLSFENSFKLSILTLTNTTSSTLFGMENLSFIDLNSFTKVSLVFFMIFGRIEIILLFFLLRNLFVKE